MTISSLLYKLILGPLTLLFDLVFGIGYRFVTQNPGLLVALLSLTINLLVLPLYRRADALQEEERLQSARLEKGLAHIRKTFRGNERFMMQQAYYRQNHYKPWYALKGSLSLMLEVPFFIAAYRYLSGLRLFQGVAFGPIRDLGAPDGLLVVAGRAINLLPILMTGINIVSGAVYTKGMPLKSKLQLYGMALVFLVLLYDSPALLVYYWTLNNLFSLAKNAAYRLKPPKKPATGPASRGDNALFMLCCAFLTLLLGALIPLDVIRSSPAEFVDIAHYHSPLQYALSSLMLAAGTFMLWFNIYYRLLGGRARTAFAWLTAAACAVCVIDYVGFGGGYGTMSAELAYEARLLISKREYLVNLLAVAAAMGATLALWKRGKALMRVVAVAGCAAVLGMSVADAAAILGADRQLQSAARADAGDGQVTIPMDRSGRNVAVVMLDRGIGRFIPYIFEEKPELKRRFSGFTFYPNTLSYGSHTNVGAPALFGGYEYTPEAMNARADEPLRDKHDEALKLMPALFHGEGYDVTVCDAPYAGYSELPDLSIFDEWPDMNTAITMTAKAIDDDEMLESNEALRHRNFFCYAVFRASPLIFHKVLYNQGRYGQVDSNWTQVTSGLTRARGLEYSFMKAYGALSALPKETAVRDEGKGTFLMIDNETTHAPVLLQLPDYTPALTVDNAAYEDGAITRRGPDGSELALETVEQVQHYHVNMAAMLKLADWFDDLREKGVYDNTRIILVADHGFRLDGLFGLRLSRDDMMHFCPLLMVKDFNAEGFTVDERFMTNADTPLLALKDIVEDPVNPFTGKALTDSPKRAPEQRVAHVSDYRPVTNNGNTFKTLRWYANANRPGDLSAWRRLQDDEIKQAGN